MVYCSILSGNPAKAKALWASMYDRECNSKNFNIMAKRQTEDDAVFMPLLRPIFASFEGNAKAVEAEFDTALSTLLTLRINAVRQIPVAEGRNETLLSLDRYFIFLAQAVRPVHSDKSLRTLGFLGNVKQAPPRDVDSNKWMALWRDAALAYIELGRLDEARKVIKRLVEIAKEERAQDDAYRGYAYAAVIAQRMP